VIEIANKICEREPLAARAAKEAISRGLAMSIEPPLAFGDVVLARSSATADANEGPRAKA